MPQRPATFSGATTATARSPNGPAEAGLAGTAPSVGAIGSDINNDRAIDFVVTGWQKSPVVYFNPREGAFHADHSLG